MPTFKYQAKDVNSRAVSGKIEADNKMAVVAELRKRNLTILSVTEVKAAVSFGTGKGGSPSVKGEDLVIFARQMATMVDAGIPILQALDALKNQTTKPAFQKVIGQIHEDIQLGSSLSAGFAKHPKVFNNLFVNMIRVGETGGVLNAMLERIAFYMEKNLKLQRKVKTAMIYPTVVICIALAITTFLLVKIVPTFAEIYSSFNAKLPSMTQGLIDVSNWLKANLWWLAMVVAAVIVALVRWHKTEKGGLILDRFFLRIPLLGSIIQKVAISRFSRTLATLIQSGVPIMESLAIVKKSIGNRVVEEVMDDIMNSVREGESIAGPLMNSKVFPVMVTRMIAIGEQSGKIEKMLQKIAEFYEDQVDAAVDGLTSVIEPVIIAFLGAVVGTIVIALFLPILTLTQLVGK